MLGEGGKNLPLSGFLKEPDEGGKIGLRFSVFSFINPSG
jgi:hypothetical protein